MSYYFAKTLSMPFTEALAKTREALAQEGFGVITEVDVQKTLNGKLGTESRPYLILGACNPTFAHEALKLDDKVGALLPCKVLVQQTPDGRTEVAAIDPAIAKAVTDNPQLAATAVMMGDKLKAVLARL